MHLAELPMMAFSLNISIPSFYISLHLSVPNPYIPSPQALNPLFIRSQFQRCPHSEHPGKRRRRLNPLFIRSQFQREPSIKDCERSIEVSIPYSSGLSFRVKKLGIAELLITIRLNPLFIRSQFQRSGEKRITVKLKSLNPLFIRSQFQREMTITSMLGMEQSLNPLFIRSQFQRKDWLPCSAQSRVVSIPYSSGLSFRGQPFSSQQIQIVRIAFSVTSLFRLFFHLFTALFSILNNNFYQQ